MAGGEGIGEECRPGGESPRTLVEVYGLIGTVPVTDLVGWQEALQASEIVVPVEMRTIEPLAAGAEHVGASQGGVAAEVFQAMPDGSGLLVARRAPQV